MCFCMVLSFCALVEPAKKDGNACTLPIAVLLIYAFVTLPTQVPHFSNVRQHLLSSTEFANQHGKACSVGAESCNQKLAYLTNLCRFSSEENSRALNQLMVGLFMFGV